MTLLLALDCSAAACSVAMSADGKVMAYREVHMERGHGEALMPMVQEVVAACDRSLTDVDVVAATVGPGSFTGVRIGLAAARGLALAVPTYTVAVTTLETLAAMAGTGEAVLAAIDTKRGDIYWQWFDGDGAALGEPQVGSAAAALADAPTRRFRIVGDGQDRVSPLPEASIVLTEVRTPRADVVASIATTRVLKDGGSALSPLYLRGAQVNLAGQE